MKRPQTISAAPGTCRWLLACLALWASAAAAAESRLPEIKSLQLGFNGQYKEALWTPAVVTIHGGTDMATGTLLLESPDGDGVGTIVGPPEDHPLQFPAGRDTTVTLYLKPGSSAPSVTVRLLLDGESPIRREFYAGDSDLPNMALPATRALILALGPPAGIEDRSKSQLSEELRPKIVQLSGVDELPTHWYGYEAVDTLVLLTSRPDVYRQLTAGSARLAALGEWIDRGGRLVLCVGRSADEILATDAPLAALAPGQLAGRHPLRQSAAFESFADTPERLELTAKNGQPLKLEVPRLTDVRGLIEAHEGTRPSDLPLVIRAPRGFGEVLFVAADPDLPPFAGWGGRQQLWEKLLGRENAAQAGNEEAAQTRLVRLGFDEMLGQLHTALGQFAGVAVPFSLVVTLIVLYIVCIGPLDYFLLKKFFRRMELTWVTFPAVVLLFSFGAYLLAHQLKGEQLRLNQADVVDVDTTSRLVRGTTWSVIFSPQTALYDLTLSAQPAGLELQGKPSVLLSWLGMPSRSAAAMRQGGQAVSLFNSSYAFSPSLDALQELPVSVWSTKALTARWSSTAPNTISAKLRDPGDKLLTGSLASALDVELTDAVLVYDRWAWPLGTLKPRASVSLDGTIDPQTVDTYFKHIATIDGKQINTPYDAMNAPIDRVLEIALFYSPAGGLRFTQLHNDYLSYLDAGRQLRDGRAVLMGRVAAPATGLLRDGQPLSGPADKHWTMYRFVLPVEGSSAVR